MSISQLSQSLVSSYSTSNTGTTAVDAVSTSLRKSSSKLQTQLDAASSNLSALGKFKGSVSALQTAASGLNQLSVNASAEEVKKKLSTFIASYNSMVTSTKTLASAASGVDRISSGMTRAMAADLSKISDLRNLGFTKDSDNILKLDTSKFDIAYQSSAQSVQGTLGKLGQMINKATTKELGNNGFVGNAIDTFTNKSSLLKLQQSALLKASQQYTSLTQSSASSALKAYTSNS